ncbi:MAG TPA: hypothetical protein PKW66_19880 [Polyangiaceae bacterium]|nr:hypothetical protein [Polyangiaceae bacterium]
MTTFTVTTADAIFTFDAYSIAFVEFGDIITFIAADFTAHKIFTATAIVSIIDDNGDAHFIF